MKRPNLIIILADDLGVCDVGCYGNSLAITPNIDRLAASGVRMTHHYSASPMCAPARAGLLTGKFPHRVGAIDVPCIRGMDRVNPKETTLPRLLKDAGYRTGLIGKWHNGGGSAEFHPSKYGYECFCGFEGGVSPYFDYTLEKEFGDVTHVTDQYITDQLTDEAIAFIKNRDERPFHLHLAYNAPHRPLEVPKEDLALFQHLEGMTPGLKTLYAMVERMDKNIGRLLDYLEKNDLMDDTVILFLSDNGPDFVGKDDMAIRDRPFHPFNGYKGDVLEGGVRVPAIISWKGKLPSGEINAQPGVFMDWLPTLCALAGVDRDKYGDIDGQDLWPCLKDHAPNTADYYWHWTRYQIVNHSNMAVYHNGYKLYYPVYGDSTTYHKPDSPYTFCEGVYDILTDTVPRQQPPQDVKPRLFYLPDDPAESVDLCDERPEVVKELKEMLEAWHQKVKKDYQSAAKETQINPGY